LKDSLAVRDNVFQKLKMKDYYKEQVDFISEMKVMWLYLLKKSEQIIYDIQKYI